MSFLSNYNPFMKGGAQPRGDSDMPEDSKEQQSNTAQPTNTPTATPKPGTFKSAEAQEVGLSFDVTPLGNKSGEATSKPTPTPTDTETTQ